jgi:hypothetical protein
MTDSCDLSVDLAATGAFGTVEKSKATAEDPAFSHNLAERFPPDEIERAQIQRARQRTKARRPPVAMHIKDRGADAHALYAYHSDDDGHDYRLADAFGTRSRHFVYAMLKSLGKVTEDHSQTLGLTPGSPDEDAFNAALAVIDGVRPQDEIEAMLAAHMAVTNLALLELVARTRDAIAGHPYQGDGIKRLDVLGNLTNKFMRTYTMQVEALARKRRKGEQNVTVKHVHVHAGAQAVVGLVNHRARRGARKTDQQVHERELHQPTAPTVADSPPVRCADQEREPLPVPRDQ